MIPLVQKPKVDKFSVLSLAKPGGGDLYPVTFQAEGVLSLPASVHPSVRPSVNIALTTTHHRFGLESPNLRQICILGCSRLVLIIKVFDFDLDLQGQFYYFNSKFWEIQSVHAITRNGLKLESSKLHHQICILGFSQLVLKMGVIDLDLQGHLAILIQNSRKQYSTFLLYTDLGQPRGVTRPNVLLFKITVQVVIMMNSLSWRLLHFNEWIACYKNKENTKYSVLLACCEGNPPINFGFPSKRASAAGTVSMPWRCVNVHCGWIKSYALNIRLSYFNWKQAYGIFTL